MDDYEFSPLFYEVLGCLIRNLLHDLNNPLSAIIGYSSKNKIKDKSSPCICENEWDIIYQQGSLLSEKIRTWQFIAHKNIPQFIGSFGVSADFVFKCFASAYSDKISLNWDFKNKGTEYFVDLPMQIHVYFWSFLFAYFLNIKSDSAKSVLELTIKEQTSQIQFRAFLNDKRAISNGFTKRLLNAWKRTLQRLNCEVNCEVNTWSASLPLMES